MNRRDLLRYTVATVLAAALPAVEPQRGLAYVYFKDVDLSKFNEMPSGIIRIWCGDECIYDARGVA